MSSYPIIVFPNTLVWIRLDLFKTHHWEAIMRLGRISKLEFVSEEALKQAEITYDKIRDEAFPTLELVINIKTGPTSVVSIALYPDAKSAESNLPAREAFQKSLGKTLRDRSMQQGAVSYFYKADQL